MPNSQSALPSQQRVHPLEGRADPGVGACDRHLRVQCADVGPERLEIQGGRDVDPGEQSACISDRERRLPGGERVAVEQRQRLTGFELERGQCSVREVGVLSQV